MLQQEIKELLHEGTVIPAHPLALDANRKLDEKRQRRLTRYYMASGAGGIGVGVHSTQFEIREPEIGLFEPVLKFAAEEVRRAQLNRPFVKIAGLTGPVHQAVEEAQQALSFGYDMGLLSMGGLNDQSEQELIKRAEKVGEVLPLCGFYLQPTVGGRVLSFDFWKDFADIPTVYAIKMAPFNRYQTLDVVRAVCASSRYKEIALYTGNDDNIIPDLLTTYRFVINGERREKSIVGGLLGQWGVWTQQAVELLNNIKKVRDGKKDNIEELLTRGVELTDANAVIFDARHHFKGCILGIHEILRRQGLLQGTWCLNPEEKLSPDQMQEIDRIYASYPHLRDDDFVEHFLQQNTLLSP